jgi:hypothetical protein
MKYVDEQHIKPSKNEIENNINENISFILNRFFNYKSEIKLKSKEYIITKYKLLYEKGIVHLNEDNYIDIGFKDEKPVFHFKKIKELISEKKITIKDDVGKENSPINSINITIDLTLLDKSKNPSKSDFIRLNCNDKRMQIRDTYDKLLFSLVGVNIKKNDEEERRRRYNTRFHYKYKKPEKKTEKEKLNEELKERLFKTLFNENKDDKNKDDKNKDDKNKDDVNVSDKTTGDKTTGGKTRVTKATVSKTIGSKTNRRKTIGRKSIKGKNIKHRNKNTRKIKRNKKFD